MSLEDWVKVRVALDAILLEIAKYKEGRIDYNTVIANITNVVNELFGPDTAREVKSLLVDELCRECETLSTLLKIEDILRKKVEEVKNHE